MIAHERISGILTRVDSTPKSMMESFSTIVVIYFWIKSMIYRE
jgi:hypothetical protein